MGDTWAQPSGVAGLDTHIIVGTSLWGQSYTESPGPRTSRLRPLTAPWFLSFQKAPASAPPTYELPTLYRTEHYFPVDAREAPRPATSPPAAP